MSQKIDLIDSFRRYKKYLWIFIGIFLVVFAGGIVFTEVYKGEERYISSSKFEVINGGDTFNLYQGVYHKITTFDDVASVLRSNEVLREVIRENNLITDINEFRQNIDLYQESKNVYILEFVFSDKILSEKINLSIIDNYLEIIESRMDNDNKELFDVKVIQYPASKVANSRILYKVAAAFLFGMFCAIIIVSGIEIIKKGIIKAKPHTK